MQFLYIYIYFLVILFFFLYFITLYAELLEELIYWKNYGCISELKLIFQLFNEKGVSNIFVTLFCHTFKLVKFSNIFFITIFIEIIIMYRYDARLYNR